ncbi:MAG: NAD-dependent epimerase/dehydratase family protein [Ardenticatenaceae bacterium]|nr:NAD-dependent epimerase/dehydratase family protein [Anaerolineales bacterium]MCB8923286.1 NAD-dependent epimerase/dehydratase family protein [Ardenticatenaceae bacterium]MCB8992027.1 NAD-dependent epimerase/dehydratase family protein [Ardenticatenaceae bacterium]MCB9004714.1 NAD-dependent epimerase/dehydratase family protein [Ardenticatenaceae bacterium]
MSIINHALQDTKVLITGATGFIGARLAERLAVEEGALVTGTGRDLQKATHLQALGVQLVQADLLDTAVMQQAIAGQEVVFHVAAWLRAHGDETQAYELNVTATETLLRLAAEAGVRRFVFVSSMNAYGPQPHDLIDEDKPLNTELRDIYGKTKAIADQMVRRLGPELGIEVAVVRPGMVYGPGSMSWTLEMVKLLKKGLPVIFGDGKGYAAPVYVDNLLDGMILTAVRPNAAGEAFNMFDPPVDWHTFFGFYGAMCGCKPRVIPYRVAQVLAWLSEHFRFLGLPLTRERLQFYTMKAVYPMTKAEDRLGYQQRVDIHEGMRRAEAWLREEGYL